MAQAIERGLHDSGPFIPGGTPKSRNLFMKHCAFLPTRLHFRHRPSSVQCTCAGVLQKMTPSFLGPSFAVPPLPGAVSAPDLFLYWSDSTVGWGGAGAWCVHCFLPGRGQGAGLRKWAAAGCDTVSPPRPLPHRSRFHHQALVEVKILEALRRKDKDNAYNVVHMKDFFYFRHHLCITFELLGSVALCCSFIFLLEVAEGDRREALRSEH